MSSTTPLCRCRVLYIGSSVPTIAKDGLQGIQEPMNKLYPVDGLPDTKGIDSWLSVWVNGVLLEYVDGEKEHFFPIDSLHYCAAVRYVNTSGYAIAGGNERFLPLESPFANLPDSRHPPIFAAILRRTTGVKILECHAFICLSANAANALVQCCFHAYADFMYLKQSEAARSPRMSPPSPTTQEPKVFLEADPQERDKSYSKSEIEFRNGDDSDSEQEEGTFATAAVDIEEPGWQRRQQTGHYDAVSLSSSTAGRYKKKETISQKPRTGLQPKSTTSKALVPYGRDYTDYKYKNYFTEQDSKGGVVGGNNYERARPMPMAMPGQMLCSMYPYEAYSANNTMIPPYSSIPLPPSLPAMRDSPPMIPPWLMPSSPGFLPPPSIRLFPPFHTVDKKKMGVFKKRSPKRQLFIPIPAFPQFHSFEEPPYGYRPPIPPPMSPYMAAYEPPLYRTYNSTETRGERFQKKQRSTQSLDRAWRRPEPVVADDCETEYFDYGIARRPFVNKRAFGSTMGYQREASAADTGRGSTGQSAKKPQDDRPAVDVHGSIHSNGTKDGYASTSRIEQNMANLSLSHKEQTPGSNPSSQLNRELMY